MTELLRKAYRAEARCVLRLLMGLSTESPRRYGTGKRVLSLGLGALIASLGIFGLAAGLRQGDLFIAGAGAVVLIEAATFTVAGVLGRLRASHQIPVSLSVIGFVAAVLVFQFPAGKVPPQAALVLLVALLLLIFVLYELIEEWRAQPAALGTENHQSRRGE